MRHVSTNGSTRSGELRIGVDARPINCEHLRGAGKYLFEILSRLAPKPELKWTLFSDRSDLPFHTPAHCMELHTFEMRGYRFRSWEQFALPRRARAAGVDLLVCPGMSLPWWQPVPTVVTLHDCIPWRMGAPDWNARWYRDGLLPRAFARCAAIITVSESSRCDIVSLWPNLADKVHVIMHGISDAYLSQRIDQVANGTSCSGVRPPYLLYVGGSIARKRLDWALKVFESLENDQLQFVACGLESHAHDEILKTVNSSLRDRMRLLSFVPESSMPALYQRAAAVLYPTLYEGFGFPALEAQAVGTPVLFSRVSSLAELEGPGAFMLPPEDLDAWVSVCRRLLAERGERPVPRDDARIWARRFSWDESARRHLEVYRGALCAS